MLDKLSNSLNNDSEIQLNMTFDAAALLWSATGLTLIALGLRHAFDVDHITAIDNLIRYHNAVKRTRFVGTGFSLGHMTSVYAELLLMVYVAANLIDQGGMFSISTGLLGAAALGIIGVTNVYAMKKYGKTSAAILISKLMPRLGKDVGIVKSSYFVGIVFGLGFDTATQLAALGMAAVASATEGIEAASLMIGVFTVGMVCMDTLDSTGFRAAMVRILGTGGIKSLSYALSAVAFIICGDSIIETLTPLTIMPDWMGFVLAGSVLAVTFAYAYKIRNRQKEPAPPVSDHGHGHHHDGDDDPGHDHQH